MAIALDSSTNRGANVFTATKGPEISQQWEIHGKHTQSRKEGLYLAVCRDGEGSKVCVWTRKTDEEDQHWSIFAKGSTEGDFEAKMFGAGKRVDGFKGPSHH
jgi:hypothetical protein